jgi:hypothetical protein
MLPIFIGSKEGKGNFNKLVGIVTWDKNSLTGFTYRPDIMSFERCSEYILIN